jgi:phenylpropionate dioxygenase-like ring-hydroxylating dioxygenase large terminal subunit
MSFLENCWYVASWSDELIREPLARTILDRPVVLYRRADGTPVALEDRCCHRALPLSLGTIEGDDVRCGYHGLKFDPTGVCVEVPGQSTIPPGAKVPSYPVAEKWNAVWIWMGSAEGADVSSIPDVFWLDDPGWTPAPGHLRIEANFQLLIDNLLDLTHVSYLHRSTLAGDAVEAVTPVTTRRDGDRVTVGRWILDVAAPPLYSKASGITGPVDRWQWITWEAPANVYFDIGCARAGTGAPDGDRGHGVSMWSTHLITPETETSTHYFFSFTRDFKLGDAEVTRILSEGSRTAFNEDLAVLEIQQRAQDVSPNAPRIDIKIDTGPLQARRTLAKLIKDERHERREGAAE